MSIADFKSEFSALLKRYTASIASPTDESSKGSPPRNHQELLDAVRDVLRSVLDIKLQYLEEAALKTPANNEIVVATPDAPDVLRMNYNQNNARFESFKSFAGVESELMGLHTHHEEKVQVLDNDTCSGDDTKNDNNKVIPAIMKNAKLSKDQCNRQQKSTLSHAVEEAQQNARKVMSSLQLMADILTPERRPEPHAVRRLSTILNPSATKKPPSSTSSSSSSSSLIRSSIQQQRAAKAAHRRSSVATADDVVTTPTTSRPMSLSTTTAKKPIAVSKLTQDSVSMSSFAVTENKSKSPIKPAKNPKYAHVQSTIPRANNALAKKKT